MALDLIVTVLAGGLTLIAAVAGICGMNLTPLPVQDSIVSLLHIFQPQTRYSCVLRYALAHLESRCLLETSLQKRVTSF